MIVDYLGSGESSEWRSTLVADAGENYFMVRAGKALEMVDGASSIRHLPFAQASNTSCGLVLLQLEHLVL